MYIARRGRRYELDTGDPGERALIARRARQEAMAWLRSRVVTVDEAAIEDLGTAIGEAVSNVARWAPTATYFVVAVGHGDGWCDFRVEDDGREPFSPRRAILRGRAVMLDMDASHGRGLAICDGILDEFRATSRATGCVVEGRRGCGCGGGK